MQSEEGFLRIFMSVVGLFVTFHAQEYKWYFLGLRLVVLVCERFKHASACFQVVDLPVVVQRQVRGRVSAKTAEVL